MLRMLRTGRGDAGRLPSEGRPSFHRADGRGEPGSDCAQSGMVRQEERS